MKGLDFDDVLNIEEEYYQNGFNDALLKGSDHSKRDGKVFGIQTGFQRFILLGALKNMNEIILQNNINNTNINNNTQINDLKLEKLLVSLKSIHQLILNFYNDSNLIQTSNSIQDVNLFETNIKTIRSKLRTIYLQLGYKKLYTQMENICKILSGEIQESQIVNDQQDVW